MGIVTTSSSLEAMNMATNSLFVASMTVSSSFALSSLTFQDASTAAFFERLALFFFGVASAAIASPVVSGRWYAWPTYVFCLVPTMAFLPEAFKRLRQRVAVPAMPFLAAAVKKFCKR